MGIVKLPTTFTDFEMVVVCCDRNTRLITVMTSENDSYAIGGYYRAETEVIPYLRMAFGGDKALAEDAVSVAYNFGAAIVELQSTPRRTYPIADTDKQKLETQALLKIEGLRDILSGSDEIEKVFIEQPRSVTV